jgi:hypothetical protein
MLVEQSNETEIQIARMDQTLQRIDHELFGNGQPGRLQRGEDRIAVLEDRASFSRGVMWAVGLVVTLLTSTTVVELIRKGF